MYFGNDHFSKGEFKNEFSNYVSSEIRRVLGKGPENLKIHLAPDEITIVIDGFMTPTEKALFNAGFGDIVIDFRTIITQRMKRDWETRLATKYGLRLLGITCKTNLEKNRRVVVLKVLGIN